MTFASSSSAGQLLDDVWRGAAPMTEFPAGVRPASLADGYDVQDAFMAAHGKPIGGWKLGLASPSAMRAAGMTRGLIGQMPADRFFAPGADIRLPRAGVVTIEFEIALALGRDIAPGQAPAQPMDAVSSVHVAYEIILSRFVDRKTVGLPSFAGDNVGFEAFVLGPAIRREDMDAIIADTVVSVDGEVQARSLTGDDLVDPAGSLGQLFDHARERGITLRAGQIVTTGTITRMFDVAVKDRIQLSTRYLDQTLDATLTA